jgi:hypothetical protein
MMTYVLSITDNYIKGEVYWLTGKITPIARRDIRYKYYSVSGRQGIAFLKEFFYTSMRKQY